MHTLNAPVNKENHKADSNNGGIISLAQSSFLHTALGGLDLSLEEELERYRHWQDNGMSYLKPFQSQSQKENNFGSLGVGLDSDSFINASAYPPAKPKLPRQNIDLPQPKSAGSVNPNSPSIKPPLGANPPIANPLSHESIGAGTAAYGVGHIANGGNHPNPASHLASNLPDRANYTTHQSPTLIQPNGNTAPLDEPLPFSSPRLELPLEPLNAPLNSPVSLDYGNYHHGLNHGQNVTTPNGASQSPEAFAIPPTFSGASPANPQVATQTPAPKTPAPKNSVPKTPTALAEPPLKDAAATSQPVTEDEFLKHLSDAYPETPEIIQEEILPPPPPHPAVVVIASLLNPVGLISLLLLLVSSATIGYLLVDPSGVIRIFNPNYGKMSPAVKANPGEEPSENHSPKNNRRERTETTTIPFVPSTGSAAALTTPNGLPSTVPANSTAKTNPNNGNRNNANKANTTNNALNPSRNQTPNFNPVPPITDDVARNNAVTPTALPPVVNETPVERPRATSRPAPRITPTAPVAARPTRPTAAPSSSNVSSSAVAASSASSVNSGNSSNNGVRYGAPLTSLPMATESAPTRPSSYRISVDSDYAQQAQRVQPDAFTRSSDGQTQLGSYRDPNAAAQRVEELRRQGIPARVEQ